MGRASLEGRERALTTRRFEASQFHWPFWGDGSDERSDAPPTHMGQSIRSTTAIQGYG